MKKCHGYTFSENESKKTTSRKNHLRTVHQSQRIQETFLTNISRRISRSFANFGSKKKLATISRSIDSRENHFLLQLKTPAFGGFLCLRQCIYSSSLFPHLHFQVLGSSHEYHFVHHALPHARTKRSILHLRKLKTDQRVSLEQFSKDREMQGKQQFSLNKKGERK